MAKSKANGSMTKADAIRNYLSSNPKAKAKEIKEALAKQGIEVSDNHIYLIKSHKNAKLRHAKGVRLRAVASA